MPSIAIILPTLNEEQTIARVIDDIPREKLEQQGYSLDIIVADSSSDDNTTGIARDKGARVIVEPQRGKGRAVRAALKQVTADYVFMLDSDYTYPAGYIPDMLHVLESGPAVVIGSRLKGEREKGAMSRLNVIGNHLLTLLARMLYGSNISDLCTGYWGFRGEAISRLELSANGFDLEADLFTQARKKGYAIAELPIRYRSRPTPAKLSSFRDGARIAWALLRRKV